MYIIKLRYLFSYLLSAWMFCLVNVALPVNSMTFTTEFSPMHDNVTVIVGRGPIELGDTARFEAALDLENPSLNALMVTSPGGSVNEAMQLAGSLKAHDFSIIAHDECASACAQILFPAGVYSILTNGSVLGIHSCSVSGERHDLCNDAIADFAVSNGFPYGTLDLFSDLYGPSDMKWMSEISARCFGFYRSGNDPKPIHGGRKACVDGIIFTMRSNVSLRPFGPSFDCKKASTRVERLFCIDRELMQSDSILGRVYDNALENAGAKGRVVLRSNQRKWIKERNAECEKLFTDGMDFWSTRNAALCLYKYNESQIYDLIGWSK